MANNQPIYWRMRNGKLISIDDMDINHLRNTLKMIVKNSNKRKVKYEIIQVANKHDWQCVPINDEIDSNN